MFFLKLCLFGFLLAGCALCVVNKNEKIKVDPLTGERQTRQSDNSEVLRFPDDSDTQNYAPESGPQFVSKDPLEGGSQKTSKLECPSKFTGVLPYQSDCRKFVNCFKGRGFIQVCSPGTLFNAQSLECDFPAKAVCASNQVDPFEPYAENELDDTFAETGSSSQNVAQYGPDSLDNRGGGFNQNGPQQGGYSPPIRGYGARNKPQESGVQRNPQQPIAHGKPDSRSQQHYPNNNQPNYNSIQRQPVKPIAQRGNERYQPSIIPPGAHIQPPPNQPNPHQYNPNASYRPHYQPVVPIRPPSQQIPNGPSNQRTPYIQPNQPTPYGSPNQPTPYGSPNQPTPYGQTNQPTPYGQTNQPTPYYKIRKVKNKNMYY
uniref:Chitin-binding type-2 domain-containing protein n=1 Tax=Cacopsylla melanoneura TaxID=428564 RepID=A0A8D8Q1L9_9HEMI